jgi:Arc/MetJ-type ribon-helix-helix transcriptional regulator
MQVWQLCAVTRDLHGGALLSLDLLPPECSTARARRQIAKGNPLLPGLFATDRLIGFCLTPVGGQGIMETGDSRMKIIQVELPERVTTELDTLVKDGWFADEAQIIRLALHEFVQRNRFALMERFQREDIAWALQQREIKAEANKP